jgi:serine/threonine-protein kinase
VIHRDIKPANLLITKSGKVKLSDFGLALVASDNKLTAAGKTMGTMHYMAPEQIRGNPPISQQSDLYSLGCVLFEMLTGKPPFIGQTAAQILQQHLEKPAPRVSTVVMDCPSSLDNLISDMLEKDPANRPVDAEEVIRRLQGVEDVITVRAKPSFDDNDRPSDGPVRKKAENKGVERAAVLASRPAVNAPSSGSTFTTILTAIVCLLVALLAITFMREDNSRYFDRAEQQFLSMLKDSQASVRIAAVRAIGELGNGGQNCVGGLARLLTAEEKNPVVQKEALVALEKIGAPSKSILGDLVRMQNDANIRPEVREQAMMTHKFVSDTRTEGSNLPYYRLGIGLGIALCAFVAWLRRPLVN